MAFGLAMAGCQPPRVCPGGVTPVDGLCPVSCAVLGTCGGGPDAADGSDAAADGASADGDAADTGPAAPRLVAPISVATVTTQRPTLHWDLPAGTSGAHVRVCSDRAMTQRCQSVDATGTSGRVTTALGHGVWFWRAWGVTAGVVGSAGSATWEFIVPARDSSVDSVRGSAMDLNGDGYADLAVGAPFPALAAGIVRLYTGAPGGVDPAAATLMGSAEMDDSFGVSIAPLGDLGGDGSSDLLIGENGQSNVWIAIASAKPRRLPNPETTPFGFGRVVVGGADYDGDGLPDAIATSSSSPASEGRVYTFPGTSLRAGTTPAHTFDSPVSGTVQFGWSLATAGDIDGDGFDDVAIGEPDYMANAGRVYLFPGGPSGPQPSRSTPIDTADGAGSSFGSSLALGDVNGDGFDDLVVGANGFNHNIGRVHLYYGSVSGLDIARTTTLESPDSGVASYGVALAVEDVTGDGLADIVVGAPGGTGYRGRIHVYAGSRTGVAAATIGDIDGPGLPGSLFGYPIAAASDVNGDGFGDVVVSALSHGTNPGVVYLFEGGPDGLAMMPSATLTSSDSNRAQFGAAIASRRPARGRSRWLRAFGAALPMSEASLFAASMWR